MVPPVPASASRSTTAGSAGAARPPGLVRMLGRAFLRRCPWCGDWKAWFRGFLGKKDRCRGCGLRWDRNTNGQELGAMVVNLILVIVVLTVGCAAVMIATYPELYVAPMIITFVILGCLMPILIYPISFTIWDAIDLRVRPPQTVELAEAQEFLANHPQGA